jgi:hypothetical protein
MKTKLLFIFSLLFTFHVSFAQLGDDGNCSPNFYQNAWANNYTNVGRAVVKFAICRNNANAGAINNPCSECTGVLINQNINGNPRQLLLTARHCLFDGLFSVGNPLDWNGVRFMFNFQSPNGDNATVPFNNSGVRVGDDRFVNYRYLHQSNINVLYHSWGIDVALAELTNPIPPHFNVHYAGWSPRGLLGFNGVLDAPFMMLHHPQGDIKKISRTHAIAGFNTPLNFGCRTVTRIIDGLIRLFGGRVVTEVICNYVDVPFMTVLAWTNGSQSGGFSGSPVVKGDGKIMGVTSWAIPENGVCINVFTNHAKFKNAYATRSMRDALNPSYNTWVNNFGMTGRDVCYADPTLLLNGNYFPDGEYQPENDVTIRAQNLVRLGTDNNNNGAIEDAERLTVFNGANFTVFSGSGFEAGAGFEVQPGATFSLNVRNNPCASPARIEEENRVTEPTTLKLENIENISDLSLQIYPNPAQEVIHFSYKVDKPVALQMILTDLLGRKTINLVNNPNHEVGNFEITFDTSILPQGMYLCTLQAGDLKTSKRVVVIK